MLRYITALFLCLLQPCLASEPIPKKIRLGAEYEKLVEAQIEILNIRGQDATFDERHLAAQCFMNAADFITDDARVTLLLENDTIPLLKGLLNDNLSTDSQIKVTGGLASCYRKLSMQKNTPQKAHAWLQLANQYHNHNAYLRRNQEDLIARMSMINWLNEKISKGLVPKKNEIFIKLTDMIEYCMLRGFTENQDKFLFLIGNTFKEMAHLCPQEQKELYSFVSSVYNSAHALLILSSPISDQDSKRFNEDYVSRAGRAAELSKKYNSREPAIAIYQLFDVLSRTKGFKPSPEFWQQYILFFMNIVIQYKRSDENKCFNISKLLNIALEHHQACLLLPNLGKLLFKVAEIDMKCEHKECFHNPHSVLIFQMVEKFLDFMPANSALSENIMAYVEIARKYFDHENNIAKKAAWRDLLAKYAERIKSLPTPASIPESFLSRTYNTTSIAAGGAIFVVNARQYMGLAPDEPVNGDDFNLNLEDMGDASDWLKDLE